LGETKKSSRRRKTRRGNTLVYTVVSLSALVGLGSLAVDWGRVEMAKTELDRGVAAAARYAAKGVSDGTALAKANSLGNDNTVDNQPLVFASADVEVGTWDSTANTFTPGGASPNAVRVTGRRTAATGNPVSLMVGQVVGLNTCDVVVRAVAKLNVTGYGVVGLNGIIMSGNSTISYWSAGGPSTPNFGNIASNGSIALNNNSTINGNVDYGPSGGVSGGTVTGNKTQLATALSFPNGSAGTYATTNDDANIPAPYYGAGSLNVGGTNSCVLPGGNYYFNNLTTAAQATLSFTGPTTIYCYGNLKLGGATLTAGNVPGNLKIVMVPAPDGRAPGAVTVSNNSALYANIYAPQSSVTLSGNGDIYGSVLGNSVSLTGTSAIHYDLSLVAGNGTVSLVK
jgi:Flp pilus assembly protein TadG